jgi:hypothetical protein
VNRLGRSITALTATSTSVVWGEDACPAFGKYNFCGFQPTPNCCAGRILSFDLSTGKTSTLAEDPVSWPSSLAADSGQIFWSNFREVRRARSGTTSGDLIYFSAPFGVNDFAFDATSIYFPDSNTSGDNLTETGLIVRAARR